MVENNSNYGSDVYSWFLPISPVGWKGMVVTVRAGERLPDLPNPYLCNAPVPLAGDATALIRRTKKITDTQQDRRDGLVEHLRRYYFACVAYQLRINDAWVTHMRRIWRMNGDATAYDVAYENLTIAYSRRKWRMHSVHPTNARRSTRFYGVWRAYVQRMGCVHAELMNTPDNM